MCGLFSCQFVVKVGRIKMNIVFNEILKILLISVLVQLSQQSMDKEQHCSPNKESDNQCSYYCYTTLKPLLQHLATAKTKEQQYEKFLVTVYNLELTIERLKSTIEVQKIQLKTHLELEKVYKEKDIIGKELIFGKNKQIQELQTQILQIQKSETNVSPSRDIIENKVLDENIKIGSGNSVQTQRLQIDKSETRETLRNQIENKVLDENINMKTENAIHLNLYSALNQNSLNASTTNGQSNANQNNVLYSQKVSWISHRK